MKQVIPPDVMAKIEALPKSKRDVLLGLDPAQQPSETALKESLAGLSKRNLERLNIDDFLEVASDADYSYIEAFIVFQKYLRTL